MIQTTKLIKLTRDERTAMTREVSKHTNYFNMLRFEYGVALDAKQEKYLLMVRPDLRVF